MSVEDFAGRQAVVTGAAAGIGRAVALALAARGADLALLDVDGSGLEGTQKLIADASPARKAHIKTVDVTDAEGVTAALDEFGFTRVDLLFNIAGIIMAKPISEHTLDDLTRLMQVNVGSVLVMSNVVAPRMTNGGVIVNTSSSAGVRPCDRLGVYGPSKAAVVFLTKTLARELAEANIRVCAVAPGGVDTPMPRRSLGNVPNADEILQQVVSATQLIKRIGQPEEIAAAMLFLASDEAAYITGMTLNQDGGAEVF